MMSILIYVFSDIIIHIFRENSLQTFEVWLFTALVQVFVENQLKAYDLTSYQFRITDTPDKVYNLFT